MQFDGLEVHYAAQQYLSSELRQARLPFWTPYLFSGFPFLADLQVGGWYPLNWPFLLAGITPRSIGFELLLHEVIACLGACTLARHLLGPQRTAAPVIAGMLYGLSGWFAAHSQHVGMVDAAAWLPWLMLVLLRLANGLTARRLAVAALVGAAIALPGSFQIALYTFFFVGVWAALEAVWQRSSVYARRMAAGLAAAGAGALTLGAVMILPALELVNRSVRAQLNALALPDIGYFHVGSLLTLAYPDYYGLLSGHYVGPGDSTQHFFYAGILLIPLAALGLSNALAARTAAFVALPFLWYALGPAAGMYRVLARLPGFNSVELPMHGWFLVALGLALLGGAGAAWLEGRVRWSGVLVPVLLLDVLIVNQLLNPLAYARTSFEDTYGATLRAFAAEVAAQPQPVERVYGPPLASVGYRNHALQSRVATTYGYNPLELAAYSDYATAAEANPRLVAGFAATHRLADGGQLQVDSTALPLARIVSSVISVPDAAGANEVLRTLDPSQQSVVTGPPPAVQSDTSATVSVIDASDSALTLRYAATTPVLLRVAIPMYPGWHATLDGADLPLVSVDAAFIGVVVPAGSGDVRVAYTPTVVVVGATISALALLALSATLIFSRRGAR